MLAPRLRRWANIDTALGEFPVFSVIGRGREKARPMILVCLQSMSICLMEDHIHRHIPENTTRSSNAGLMLGQAQHQTSIGGTSLVCWCHITLVTSGQDSFTWEKTDRFSATSRNRNLREHFAILSRIWCGKHNDRPLCSYIGNAFYLFSSNHLSVYIIRISSVLLWACHLTCSFFCI